MTTDVSSLIPGSSNQAYDLLDREDPIEIPSQTDPLGDQIENSLFWEKLKKAGKIILINLSGLGTIATGAYLIYDAVQRHNSCIDETSSSEDYDQYACANYGEGLSGGAIVVAGFALEFFQIFLYDSNKTKINYLDSLKLLRTPEHIVLLRRKIQISAIPVSLHSLGGDTLIQAGIITEETAKDIHTYRQEYCQIIDEREAIENIRKHALDLEVREPSLKIREEKLNKKSIDLLDRWEQFQIKLLNQIKVPIKV